MSKVPDILDTMSYGPAPEDASPALQWIAKFGGQFGVFIGGDWHPGLGHFESRNPATGEILAKVTQATPEQVDQAVQEAKKALPIWQALSPTERGRHLYNLSRHIQKNSRLFAVLETLDNGKPIRESRDLDIPLASRHIFTHAGWATLRDEEFPNAEPVGVCGQIIPWNFPLLMLAWKIAPALAMGNTVVLKPAEFTSLTALLFAEICQTAGLPPGVVNIVTGDGEVGKSLVIHPDIQKIAFTGSTEVGRSIRLTTAGTSKKLSLELGGKSPFIVFDDADLDSAVEGVVDAIWFNQGQVCCAGSRLLVQESIAAQFFQKLKARMATLRVGDPLDKAIDMGALIDPTQLDRVSKLVETGIAEGAKAHVAPCQLPSSGWFYPPTLLTDVEPASTLAQEEIFGPVLVAMTFRTPPEAVALANNSKYGLAASIWTQNLDVAHDIAAQVKAGTVWVNSTNLFDGNAGFGGFRESGFGREGGREGLSEYLKYSYISANNVLVSHGEVSPTPGLDRTHKLFIGGKQVRPDGGYSMQISSEAFAIANRKDVRNAIEANENATSGWASATPYFRSQILYYLAENLSGSRGQMIEALSLSACPNPEEEFAYSIDFILWCAAWADKWDGAMHQGPAQTLIYTRPEPWGVAAAIAPNSAPLLGLLWSAIPLVAIGNCVTSLASPLNPLPAAELYRLLDSSDFPPGVWNILTGLRKDVVSHLASHQGVATIWCLDPDCHELVSRSSVTNLKSTWNLDGDRMDLYASRSPELFRRATQVKNIWVPYGS
ncbi:MAG: aldehyde dehydrogenase family protein [Fimbriimonadaceae bacterium]|jgi:aldehyde dehydrogenase (NAD+)|nr:aldehyde dehydrogenase family protein [Fimbriimonadaceae bacterium]